MVICLVIELKKTTTLFLTLPSGSVRRERDEKKIAKMHYENIFIPIKFSQKASLFKLIIISSP